MKMYVGKYVAGLSSFILILSSCNRQNSDSAFSALESGGLAKDGSCKISAHIPDKDTVRVGATAGTKTQFIVQAAATCQAEFLVNDELVKTTGLVAEIESEKFKPGENTVKVRISNSQGSDSYKWTVTKNNAPTCNTQSPIASSPVNVSVGSEQILLIQGKDLDSDNLEFKWKFNGIENQSILVPIINSSSAAQVSFRPLPANGGNQTVTAEISDGYDKVSCDWNVKVSGDCSITAKSPDVTGNIIRVLSPNATQNSFAVTTYSAGCTVNWTLNNVPLSGTSTSQLLTSSQFAVGNNVLTASVTGATGQSSQTWTVVKNTAPSCGTMTPSNLATQTTGIGQSMNLSLTASDVNTDPLSFTWHINDQSVSGSILSASSTGNTSTATFIPTSAEVGAKLIQAIVNDGYETTTCTWTTQVLPACAIASSFPDHAVSQRFAAQTAQTKSFNLIPNYPSYCTVSWTLDGNPVGTGNVYNLSSTDALLASGSSHTLTAIVSNGQGSSVSRNWNLIKNSPPSCAGLNPSNTSLSMNEGVTQLFQAGATDIDASDTFTFSWKLNGATSSALTSLGSTASTSSANFTPTIANVGSNLVSMNISDGLDVVTCSWNVAVQGNCTLTGNNPSNASPIKIKANDVVGSLYSVTTSTAGCPVTWAINGTPVAGTPSFRNFISSDFTTGNNILQATVSNGTTSSTVTWNVRRNSLPTAVQAPNSTSTQNLPINAATNFTGNMTDADGDTMTPTWKVNGIPLASLSPALTYSVVSATNPFQNSFTFNSSYTGSRLLSLSINDGTDDVDFDWNLMIYNNCSVASSFPSGATQRIPTQTNNTTTYGIIPNDSSCTVTWSLNGSNVGTGNLYNLQSLNGSLGASNVLTATLSNGIGSPATQSWTVVKNTPPTCLAGQVPAATGNDLFYNATLNMSCSATDSENDPVSFNWRLNNAYGDLFSSISSSGYSSSATLNPTIGVLGSGQTVTSNFYDGWDTGICSWSINIKDPASVAIQACSPVAGATSLLSQYSASPLKYDIKTFTVSATGPDITYRWKENGSLIGGQTNAQLKVGTSATNTYTGETPDHLWSVGTRSLVVEVVDKYNNVQSCTWDLKRNQPPTVNTSAAGTGGLGFTTTLDSTGFTYNNSSIRMFYGSQLQIKVYGADADSGDGSNLQYFWKVNNQQLDVGGDTFLSYVTAGDHTYSTATITPNYDSNRLGAQTITVVISDGLESASYTWNLQVNMFSQECNILYNAPVVSRGGQACTLVGQAGVGGDLKPSTDMGSMRFQPWDFAWDGNNLIFSDYYSNSVFYYNRGTSAADNVTRFGKSIAFGTIVPLIGVGGYGIVPDTSLSTEPFKLNSPRQVAYYNGRLYIADITNHRVVVLKEDGTAASFVGRLSDNAIAANNAAANSTTGSAGTSQMCYDASGLTVVNESGTIFLYMACRHSIKKANITNPADAVNYGKTYLVVGKPNPAGDIGDGWEDGDPTTEARTSRPRTLDVDSSGNVYWIEFEGRLRVLNRSASTLNFFPARSTSLATTFTVSDAVNSGGAITGLSTASILSTENAPTLTATKAVIHTPANGATSYAGNSLCIPIVVQLQDASNKVAVYGSNVSVTMSAAPANVNFYANYATCNANGATQTAYTITAGQTQVELWARSATNGTYTLTATTTGVTTGTKANYTVVATNANTTAKILVATGPNSFHFNDCTRVWIVPANGANAPTVAPTAGTKIRLYAQNGGNFYASSDSTCSGTPIMSLTFSGGAAGYTEGFIYYARTNKVPAGKVGTIFGNPSGSFNTVTSFANGTAGNARFRYGFGLSVHQVGANILGFFITNWDSHQVAYVNNVDSSGGTTLTQIYGGRTFGSNASSTGAYHEFQVVGGANGSAGFNGDTKTGINSRMNSVAGIIRSPDLSTIYLGDITNWRLRKMVIDGGTGNGILGTDLGTGKARYGWFGDAAVSAVDAVMEQPTDVLFDSGDKSLLISDMRNGRIRRVSLTKGTFETYLGRQRGDHTIPTDDRFAMMLGGPQQMTLLKTTGANAKNFLLFADSSVGGAFTGVAANTTCAVRGFNRDPLNTRTIFNQDIQPEKISNIMGEYSLGCQSAYTLEQDALNVATFNPTGIATDGTNLYVSDYTNHCIIQIDGNNIAHNFIGRCGTSGSADGDSNGDNATNSTLITLPTQMVMDPANPTNFFFTDGHNQTTAKIRYANTTSSGVYFAKLGGNALGKSVGNVVRTTTIWNFAPASTTGRINALAVFGSSLVCFSSGGTNNGNTHLLDSNIGAHAVFCFDRSSASGTPNRIIGLDPTSTYRGGSALGTGDELRMGYQVQVNQPHGIAFDDDGNLYISERGSHIIRMVRRWW